MMRFLRISFLTRIAIILIFSLIAIQILTVMGYFIQRSNNTGTGFRLPLPDQVLAIVELIEKTKPEDRTTILRAVSSAHLQASITRDPHTPPSQSWRASGRIQQALRDYLSVIQNRQVTVLVEYERTDLLSRIIPFVAPARAMIIISLEDGQNLVIQSLGFLLLNVFGFPPGFWAGIVGFGVALLAIVIIRREVRPLRRLAEAANSLDLREPHPIPDFPSSASDIRAVISAFNRMQERIALLIRERMEMIGGFSHDVRTFATRLRLRAELVEDETERARTIRDIDDMISLLDDALYAVQDRVPEESQELVDVGQLLRDEVEDRRETMLAASLTITPDAEDISVLGNAVALRRLFANLVENAITYGGEARISLERRDKMLVVAIEDNGPGIPPEHRMSAIQAFVRLEASRSRKTGGAGLGLAIAKKVTDAHGGSLIIEDAAPRGARILVSLPYFE
ncbi:MAG: HAMP domain-containing protein [Rhodomicrobium sp.]|nr:HAMP domain-containing protein [Rhodomicrobium sp.]